MRNIGEVSSRAGRGGFIAAGLGCEDVKDRARYVPVLAQQLVLWEMAKRNQAKTQPISHGPLNNYQMMRALGHDKLGLNWKQ